MIITLLHLFLLTTSANAIDLDYSGYLRGPVGSSSMGGKEIQITNPGSQGNEFRLGNEVSYAEAYFTAHLLKPKPDDSAFFDTNLTLAFNAAMNSQYGDTTSTTDYLQVIQGFVRGGNIDGVKITYWAGKRFYRETDVHMDDFYYFANMSGNGGGVEDIPFWSGTFSLAYLQHSDSSVIDGTTGIPSKQVVDLRVNNFKLSDTNKLFLWFAAGYTAPGNGLVANQPVVYESGRGIGTGIRYRHDIDKTSYNDFAIMYGTGVLQNFLLDTTAYAPSNQSISNQTRWRLVENLSQEINDHWGNQTAIIYESADTGTGINSQSDWLSIGNRAVYYLTDHYHLLFEAGESIVNVASEKTATGAWTGQRSLTRATFGPEVAIGKGYYRRPVIRAYVTYSYWNDANKDAADSQTVVGALNAQNISALNNMNGLLQFGVEGEVWF